MADRVMYVKPGCPYCQQARDEMGADGLEWEERDATTRSDWREELMTFTKGNRQGAHRRARRPGRDRGLEGPRLNGALRRPVGRPAPNLPKAGRVLA